MLTIRTARLVMALLLLLDLTLVTGCSFQNGGPAVLGSGVAKTEKRALGAFKSIDVSGAIDIEVAIGKERSLEATADDNLLPLLVTDVQGDKLKVYTTGSTSSNIGVKVKVCAPELKSLSGSGANRLSIAGLKGKSFMLTVSGASRATLAGTLDHVDIDCSGASHVDAGKLEVQTAKVSVSGASSADVDVARSLDASASGASTINYSGSATEVKNNVSGASRVNKK
jgi:hypothetical protein